MSRAVSIYYHDRATGRSISIEVTETRDVLGPQRSSMHFWSLPRLREIGIVRLADLGVTDPVIFSGWDDLALLRRELTLLDQHLPSIDFPLQIKTLWLINLLYCYHLLVETAPHDSEPCFMIG